jgi:hypothetical protein
MWFEKWLLSSLNLMKLMQIKANLKNMKFRSVWKWHSCVPKSHFACRDHICSWWNHTRTWVLKNECVSTKIYAQANVPFSNVCVLNFYDTRGCGFLRVDSTPILLLWKISNRSQKCIFNSSLFDWKSSIFLFVRYNVCLFVSLSVRYNLCSILRTQKISMIF